TAPSRFKNHIVTEIKAASEFYRVEDYRQQYLEKRPGALLRSAEWCEKADANPRSKVSVTRTVDSSGFIAAFESVKGTGRNGYVSNRYPISRMVWIYTGLCGSDSIFDRKVVTHRSTLRCVTATEFPHTASRMVSRARAQPGRVAKYSSSLNSFAVSSISTPLR